MKKILIALIVFVALIAAGFTYQTMPKQTDGKPLAASSTTQQTATTTAATGTTSQKESADHSGMKLYRNEEWGFEFWYPEEWEWQVNAFKNPYSKFNASVIKIDGRYTNLFDYMNVVTPDSFNNFLRNMNLAKAEESDLQVGGTAAKQYRYTLEESMPITVVVFPIDDFYMIFEVERKREKEFERILSTFRFFTPAVR